MLLVPLSGKGQNQDVLDSLHRELKIAKSDSLKIEINHQLFLKTYQYDPATAKDFYIEILRLASNSKNINGMYKGYFGAAAYYAMTSRFDSSLFYFNKAYEVADLLQENKLKIESLLAISHIHLWKNEVNEAKMVGRKSLALSENSSDSVNIALSYKNLGEIYSMENNLDSAAASYLKTIKILENTKREKSKLGDSYIGIGEIYMNLRNFEKSQEFLDKGILLFRSIDDYDGVMFASSMLGALNFEHKSYQAAIELLAPALEYYESVGDPYRISETNRYLGLSYLNTGNFSDAEIKLSDAVSFGREAGEPVNLADALMGYGDLLFRKQKYAAALELFKEADNLYSNVDHMRGKIQSTQMLALLFEQTGDFEKSNSYLKTLSHLKDSLNIANNSAVVQELEAKYQNEKKQQQIVLLETQNLLKEEEKERQRNVFMVSIAAAVLVIFLLYILFRTHQKANRKLKELDNLKSRFFANISHEFRTPLTLISGPINQKLSEGQLEEKERQEFEMIDRNSRQLLLLVDQLLDLSKLESGGYKLKIRKEDIVQLLKTLTSSFHYSAQCKNISLTVSLPESPEEVWYDGDATQKIVSNLLSNAVKYTPENGSIHFTASIANGKLQLVCENSGAGISEEDQKRVFDRFFQQHNESGGAGIGLALVKELVEVLNGKVTVTSVPDKNTVFKVTIPVKKSDFKDSQILDDADLHVFKAPVVQANDKAVLKTEEEFTGSEQPILLIVEDNEDVRNFIKSILKNEYHIIETENGKKGIALAIEHIPDIIISDVMMPEIDGAELCKTLKNDERTSHIPIVLLTARAGDENKLAGFETGADDYITKPFNSKILKVRLEKLLEIRRKLQARFSQEIILKPKNITITSSDEKFFNKIQAVLDSRLSDSSFSAEVFSGEIGMSRMQLHRKLKALTGLSANHFIRNQRLIFAADLLSRSDINISEVGYLSGFSDPSYFAKCFKEHYRCTPTEYANKAVKE